MALSRTLKSKRRAVEPAFDVQNAPVKVGDPATIPPQMLKVDTVYRQAGQVIVTGWSTAKTKLDLRAGDKALSARRLDVLRPDVAENFELPSNIPVGFALSAKYTEKEPLTLEWEDDLGQRGCSEVLKFTGGADTEDDAAESSPIDSLTNEDGERGRSTGSKGASQAIASYVDSAQLLNNSCLLLVGWAVPIQNDVGAIQLKLATSLRMIDITHRAVPCTRSDLKQNFPWLRSDDYGFIAIVRLAPEEAGKLRLQCSDGAHSAEDVPITPLPITFSDFETFLSGRWIHSSKIMKELRESFDDDQGRRFIESAVQARRKAFFNRFSHIHTAFEISDVGAMAIDRGIALDSGGLLLYGWRHFVTGKVKSIHVHTPDGLVQDITSSFFATLRQDVVQSLNERFPEVTERSGFICHVPLPTTDKEPRLIELELESGDRQWLRIPMSTGLPKGIPLIKHILSHVPAADRMRPQLFELFDQQLGAPIESVSAGKRGVPVEISEQQYGVPPKDPKVSVIVPLYGRYDFVRYQLSHFANDPDFQEIDLIYVIDDPTIIGQTNELATIYYPVFGVPFRTVSYNRNLGFAGANNVGVGLARGKAVLLLNSDVLPKHTKWVSALYNLLESLPDAGAVGPLLQFADNAIQHAGMVSRQDPRLPGFLLNIHPLKGMPWTGPDSPREFDMLTAACLMLKKDEYLEIGGFDEGYVIGDFEDSDLCLSLRKRGKRLWLVPEVKLWHLERQSQNLENIAGYRQLITLFNGWRFRKKIRDGLIADPMKLKSLEG